MEKYLHKYIFLKDGRGFYFRSIENGVPCLFDLRYNKEVSFCFDEEEIDHIADEICKAVIVE